MIKILNALAVSLLVPALSLVALGACSDDDDSSGGPNDVGGNGGTAGTGGTGGSAGGTAGSAGSAGTTGGAAGSAGSAGSAGTGGAPGGGGGFQDLIVNGSNFSPHTAHKLFAALIRLSDGVVVASQPVDLVGGETFSFTWPGVLRSGAEYALDYYADVDGNGKCDPPPPGQTDHVWRKALPVAGSEAVTFAISHDTAWTDQCAGFNDKPARFDLSFEATAFTPHVGALVVVAVSRADTGSVIARKAISPVAADGKLSLAWKGLVETGVAYNVDYYADVTKDGQCNDAPDDHVWRFPVAAVTGKVDVAVVHTSEWGKYCDSFNK